MKVYPINSVPLRKVLTGADEETIPDLQKSDVTIKKIVPRLKKRRFGPLKISNQIPKRRRLEIEKGLEETSKSANNWTREGGASNHIFLKKRIKPGTIRNVEFNLLDIEIGESWPINVTVVHGIRPGPTVTLLGAVHGDELVGPLALTYLCGPNFIGDGHAIDPSSLSGTIRIVSVVNLPGYYRQMRDLPDGRDLNRHFPGVPDSNTTSRVASRIWSNIISGTDYIVDLHSAAKGRTNMPQIRVNLAHSSSNLTARSFGIETILDTKGPRGSLRRVANDSDIACITYEGGGADEADPEAVQVAMYGILNVLRNLRMIPGYPSRPRFRILASGSEWLRSDQGGLLDVLAPAGSYVKEGEIVATVTDPHQPGISHDIVSPSRGLLICTATYPFVTSGTPIGHLLPMKRGVKTLMERLDDEGCLIISGSDGEPPWREDDDVEDIPVEGKWSGGSPDAEWGFNHKPSEEEEEAA
ncbi:MAG: putative deacylase [Candidatus Thalassarchaeaceae archaeon]|mgnify:FL=1|jgi:predicted deacylase|tara:strand:+ start:614 stop:2023 length:1410 start_codon:yes stop_codon:yes gene_type:complete